MSVELKTKKPSESYFEKVLPFASDEGLRDQYVNYMGDIRFGKILEEMDMAAGIISYRHADGFEQNLGIVTAACDRIDLLGPLRVDRDLRIMGQVNHVGRSSMEVGLRLDSRIDDQWTLVSRAYFIMVARNLTGAAPVNMLSPQTEEEKRRDEEGKKRAISRKDQARSGLLNQPPTGDESSLIHDMYLKLRAGELDGVPMAKTLNTSLKIMQPQERNIHNKIFGGHIMRLSFESGFMTAHLFCKKRPWFLNVDHFDFYQPVEIGSFVRFTSQVIFTGKTSFVVQVKVWVVDPTTGAEVVTNVSYFTFAAINDQKKPIPVPRILPNTYEEQLKYLNGRRRYLNGKALRSSRETS